MRPRLISRATGLALAAVIGALVAAGCTSTADTSSSGSGYPERTSTVGAIDIKARPVRLDSSGASIEITFDSHAASFDADPTTAITLEVAGTKWPAAGWDGDPPSGHHRKGTLRFTSAGAATGTATLTIAGLPQPAQFTWTIGGT